MEEAGEVTLYSNDSETADELAADLIEKFGHNVRFESTEGNTPLAHQSGPLRSAVAGEKPIRKHFGLPEK